MTNTTLKPKDLVANNYFIECLKKIDHVTIRENNSCK